MRELTKEDIRRNKVNTISQYYILDYLKKNLNIDEFKVYIIDNNNMKVVDKENKDLYFNYNNSTKEITYQDEFETKEQEYEIGL